MRGRCHLCHEITTIRYCSACQHFFCEGCRYRYWQRGLEAVKQMVGGRQAGCCGPVREYA